MDGVEKQIFTINDIFPGPTIEVRSGDVLVVNVLNNLTEGEASLAKLSMVADLLYQTRVVAALAWSAARAR